MRDYVIINGVNSLTIDGLAISKLPPITKPLIRSQREEIDGRDGDIITELGYSAYDKQLEIGLFGSFDIDAIIKYFTGEGTIVFSNESDKYYNFKIINQIDYEKLLKFKTATVTLHCQPFKYPVDEIAIEGEAITVSGSGSNITLNNTVEAPMTVNLKGNTTQQTYTGTNILQTDGATTTKSNVTCTNNGDGVFTINGTASANASFPLTVSSVGMEMGSGQAYTLVMDIISNGGTTGSALTGAIQKSGTTQYNFFSIAPANSTGLKVQVSTPSEAATLKEINYYVGSGVQINNLKIRVYMVKGSYTTSTVPSYEPYTGGIPSPNPSYPQDIHTVKGDNTINVVGKNLLNPSKVEKGRLDNGQIGYASNTTELSYTNTSITFTTNAYWRGITSDYIEAQASTDYMFSSEYQFSANDNIFISACYDENKNWLGNATTLASGNYARKFTTVANTKYVRINIQVKDAGTTIINNPQLEKSSTATSYEAYNGASYPINLSSKNLFDKSSVTYGYRLAQNGTNYTDSAYFVSDYIKVKPSSTYSVSYTPTAYTRIALYDTNKSFLTTNDSNQTFTLTSNVEYIRLCNQIININDIQLESGNPTTYTPYFTPIELNKISTYQDYIRKSTGKNLFDKDNVENDKRLDASGQLISNNATGFSTTGYIKVKPNTTYTYSRNTTSSSYYVNICEYTSDKTHIQRLYSAGETTTKYVFTTPSNCEYLRINDATTNLGTIQLEEGKITTPVYEPYGKIWYKYSAIGKVASYNGETITTSYISTTGGLDTGATVYYVLNTPTYTKITDENLIRQLEQVLYSKNPQTNIIQENDDAPFDLDVSLSYTNTMNVNNVGNIYAKPILELEGSGNIEVVLNDIQILEINLGDGGKIAIDVPNLQAYNPDDDTLMNRLVTGDYMKLLIQEGDNTITFNGSVTSATLTKYTRYI